MSLTEQIANGQGGALGASAFGGHGPQHPVTLALGLSLFDGVLVRMTPTDAYIGEGYGYQPPEHWQAIHDSAVAAGALAEPAADLGAGYTNEFVRGWNA